MTTFAHETAAERATDAAPVDPVEDEVLRFLATRTGTALAPDEDVFASGVVTSLFALQLVMYLEKTFGVAVAGDDLTLDNFRTVRDMASLVHRLRAEDDPDGRD